MICFLFVCAANKKKRSLMNLITPVCGFRVETPEIWGGKKTCKGVFYDVMKTVMMMMDGY